MVGSARLSARWVLAAVSGRSLCFWVFQSEGVGWVWVVLARCWRDCGKGGDPLQRERGGRNQGC